MTRKLLARSVVAVLLVGTAITGLSACQSQPSGAALEILTQQLPSDVTAKGIVLAGVLLQSGDIEKAVSAGIVTPAEVDMAKKAIDLGNMKYWAERAAKEKN
jgi:hypothetical protein